MTMLSTPDGDGLLDAVLDDRLVHEHQHLLRLRLGGGQEAGAEPGGGEDGLANRAGHAAIVSQESLIAGMRSPRTVAMIDPALLRDNLDAVRAALRKRGADLTRRARGARGARSASAAGCCPSSKG